MDCVNSLKMFTDSVIEKNLTYELLIKGLEEGFSIFSRGSDSGIAQPVRLVVPIQRPNNPMPTGFFGSMPVYSSYHNMIATKLVTFFPGNKDTSTHNAVVLLFNADNGKPEAILDAETLTAKRTAAASAVATKYLTNGNPHVLAILGSGVQARSHYAALSHLYEFKQVRIWNHRKQGAEKLSGEIGGIAVACDTVEETVRDADVIVTVTFAQTPILKAEWVKKGAHINAIGACRPDWAELDGDLMRSAVVYVDSLAGANTESGDIILAKASIYAEIGAVVNGTKEGKRTETTVFKGLGMAIEDAVAAKIVLDHADS